MQDSVKGIDPSDTLEKVEECFHSSKKALSLCQC